MSKNKLVAFFILCISFACNLTAKTVVAKYELELAVINVGEPLGYVDDQGNNAGIYYEITEKLAKATDMEVTIKLLPFQRMIGDLVRGKTDCAIFFTSTERQQTFTQIGLAIKKPVIIALRPLNPDESKFIVENLAYFEGKTLGHVRGAQYSDALEKNTKIIKWPVNSYRNGLRMLAKGRIDGFVGGKETIDEHYAVINYDYYVLQMNTSWLQCSKQSPRMTPEMITKVSNAYASISKNDVSKIIRKYIPTYQPIE